MFFCFDKNCLTSHLDNEEAGWETEEEEVEEEIAPRLAGGHTFTRVPLQRNRKSFTQSVLQSVYFAVFSGEKNISLNGCVLTADHQTSGDF